MSNKLNWMPIQTLELPGTQVPVATSNTTLRPIQPASPLSNASASRSIRSNAQTGTKRNRSKRACDSCRQRKLKCEIEQEPNCRRCIETNQTCTFNYDPKKRGAPKGYIEALEKRLKSMEKLLLDLNKDIRIEDAEEEDKDEEKEDEKKKESTESKSQTVAELSSSIKTGPQPRYVGDMSVLPLLAQKINFDDARIASKIGMHIKRFGQTMVCYEEAKPNGSDENHRQLEERGLLKPGQTIKGLNDWIYKVAGIDKDTSDTLMGVYFAFIYPGLPILNKELFLKQYRGKISGYPSAPLLNSIYGSAVRYIETCRTFGDDVLADFNKSLDIPKGWSEQLFDNVISYFKVKYIPVISTVQAAIICQFHRASLDGKIASGWLLNSILIRSAQDLGLHRSCESWDISDSEKETRRRVWWAVYMLDKWSAAATGKPQTIFDEDCDEAYPKDSAYWNEVMDEPTDDQEKEEEGSRYPSLDSQLAQQVKSEQVPIFQPFLQLCKLSKILSQILQCIYTPQSKRYTSQHGSDAILSYLNKALSEWRSGLPPILELSRINVERLERRKTTPLISVSGLIYLSYCTLLILLHRPFIEKDRDHSSALNVCVSAAIRCIDIAEKMDYHDFFLASWNFAIYPLFTASLVHIYNTSNPDIIVSDVAKSNLIKLTKVVQQLTKVSQGAVKLNSLLMDMLKERDIDLSGDQGELTSKSKSEKTPGWKDELGLSKEFSYMSNLYHNNVGTQITKHINNNKGSSVVEEPKSDENWVNELASSLQATSSVVNNDTDPYSQYNFGLNNIEAIPSTEAQTQFNSVDTIFGLPGSYQELNHDQNSEFRNRPENPFWTIPSTMELDDWSSYLSSLNTRWI